MELELELEPEPRRRDACGRGRIRSGDGVRSHGSAGERSPDARERCGRSAPKRTSTVGRTRGGTGSTWRETAARSDLDPRAPSDGSGPTTACQSRDPGRPRRIGGGRRDAWSPGPRCGHAAGRPAGPEGAGGDGAAGSWHASYLDPDAPTVSTPPTLNVDFDGLSAPEAQLSRINRRGRPYVPVALSPRTGPATGGSVAGAVRTPRRGRRSTRPEPSGRGRALDGRDGRRVRRGVRRPRPVPRRRPRARTAPGRARGRPVRARTRGASRSRR